MTASDMRLGRSVLLTLPSFSSSVEARLVEDHVHPNGARVSSASLEISSPLASSLIQRPPATRARVSSLSLSMERGLCCSEARFSSNSKGVSSSGREVSFERLVRTLRARPDVESPT